jgi:hypothetical protein
MMDRATVGFHGLDDPMTSLDGGTSSEGGDPEHCANQGRPGRPRLLPVLAIYVLVFLTGWDTLWAIAQILRRFVFLRGD